MIYADNAATTSLSDSVFVAMEPFLKENYGNPSSMYKIGRTAKKAVESAREKVASALSCSLEEIIFTSGGSESDNYAVKGTAENLLSKGKKHIITSSFEHHAVLNSVHSLEKFGYSADYIRPSSDGFINPEDIKSAIKSNTSIVSIMYANNEIGTIQPIDKIADICRESGVLFHTDAVGAVGNIPINLNKQNTIDMLSLSAHKFHGPKGVGALFVRKGTALKSLIDGGSQEYGKRAGTENVAGIVGLAQAITEAVSDISEKNRRITAMRDSLLSALLEIKGITLNGSTQSRLPGNINISVEAVEGESLVFMLDTKGVCVSTGSACTSGFTGASHVLSAIGVPEKAAKSSIRITLGSENTAEEIAELSKVIPNTIDILRSLSSEWISK